MLGLLILAGLMVILASSLSQPSGHCHDSFLGNDNTPMISHNSFNSNSKSNDYFYDKTGMKGTAFRSLSEYPKYAVPDKKEIILPEDRVIKHLEIYPSQFYDKCCPDFNQHDLHEPVHSNDPIHTRLGFNQGVLYNQMQLAKN
jgi:hypothetical protein